MTGDNDYGAPRARHAGMTNVIWADGHVKATRIPSFFAAPGDNTYQTLCANATNDIGTAACSPCLIAELGCQPK